MRTWSWLARASYCVFGAGEETRTPDPRITNALLYQLSYTGVAASAPAEGECPCNRIPLSQGVADRTAIGRGCGDMTSTNLRGFDRSAIEAAKVGGR